MKMNISAIEKSWIRWNLQAIAKNLHQPASTTHGNVNFHLTLDFHENASQDAAGTFHP